MIKKILYKNIHEGWMQGWASKNYNQCKEKGGDLMNVGIIQSMRSMGEVIGFVQKLRYRDAIKLQTAGLCMKFET